MSEELSDAAALMLGIEEETPTEDHPPETATLDEPQDAEQASPEAEAETAPADLSKLLEKAELDPKDFYKLTVPGTEQTFGEAKDALQSVADRGAEDAKRESDFRDRENGLLTKARAATELYDLLPAEVKTDAVREQFEAHKLNDIKRENQLTLESIPEWRDPVQSTSDREGIAELMMSYGFSEAEVGQLYGSRELKAWRDYMSLKRMVSGIADKEVKKAPKQLNTTRRRAKRAKAVTGATEGGAILLESFMKGKKK